MSYQCFQCQLIFKSKVFLFEHLNKVHCLDVANALRGAGLKYAESNRGNTDNRNSRSSGKTFKCQFCNFTTSNQDHLTKHEKQCHEKEKPDLTGTVISSETPGIQILNVSTNQCIKAEEDPPFPPDLSTSSFKYAPITSKDLKTYKRPSQTISKYIAAPSGSNENPLTKLADGTKETLIEDETPSSSSGVFEVTAKSLIDMSSSTSYDHLLISDLRAPKYKDHCKVEVHMNVGRRDTKESLEGPPAKKAKSGKVKTVVSERENANKQSPDFTFEVSDEEMERNVILEKDSPNPKVYFCKQCDFSDGSFKRIISHYQNDHPYVRCNANYIQSVNDQSASFRCLECPVEFSSAVDLKWHYAEKHPEAPDVFKMKLNELNLIFKCFSCPFTSNTLKALREHYKERHPTCQVGNSLFFCQYSVSKSQEESPLTETHTRVTSPEKSSISSPERGSTPGKDVKYTPLPQDPTSNKPEVAKYKCIRCEFMHKSVAVMHIHYKKEHPNDSVKSKSSGLKESEEYPCNKCSFKSNSKSDLTRHFSESHPSPAKDNSLDPLSDRVSTKTPEVTMYRCIKCTFMHKSAVVMHVHYKKTHPEKIVTIDRIKQLACDTLPVSKSSQKAEDRHEESHHKFTAVMPKQTSGTSKLVKSVQDETPTKRSPKRRETTASTLSSSSALDTYHCLLCSYRSPSIRSVLSHHNASHSKDSSISQQEIIQHSVDIKEKKREKSSETRLRVELSSKTEAQSEKGGSVKKHDDYARVEKLFYCQICNFGSPSPYGVLNHQCKMHRLMKPVIGSVIEHTASVLAKIKELKSLGTSPPSSSYLPLPILNKGDEEKFFCNLCNYRHTSPNTVCSHYSKKHGGNLDRSSEIYEYTSIVLQQVQKSPLKSAGNQEPTGADKLTQTSSGSVAPPAESSETERSLKCHVCSYKTPYVFLLKLHLQKTHKSYRKVSEILRQCFRQGSIKTGFHCEWCVFSHTKARVVHRHYQKHHTASGASLDYVHNMLCVGPTNNKLLQKKKKSKLKSTHQDEESDGSPTSQSSGQNESKTFPCSTCSFQSSSQSGLARHCKEFHPSSSKVNSRDLSSNNKTSIKSQLEELSEMPGVFESFQVPLEDAEEAAAPSSEFKCTVCFAAFDSQHGLNVHCGLKHLKLIDTEKQETQVKTKIRVHLFVCPYCSYVNTNYQGILTHCQMKHPALDARANSYYVDPEHLYNRDEYVRKHELGEILKFSGYICKTCSQICASLNKLDKHREQVHNETVPNRLKPAAKPSAVSQKELTKPQRALASVSKASVLNPRYSKIRCPHCSYAGISKIALSRHMHKRHQNKFTKDNVYKCMLCLQVCFAKKKLAKHYVKIHGNDAYLKYYVPMYNRVSEPTSQQQQNKSSRDKRLVFKCPKCVYVHSCFHGMLTHFYMKHPTVTAKANQLETTEILVSNIVKLSSRKGIYERGYLCKKCPLIYPTMATLEDHSLKKHDKTAESEPSDETEGKNPAVDDSSDSESEDSPLKNQSDDSETVPSSCTPETLNTKLPQNEDFSYNCQICAYVASARKKLQKHYKYTHKLNAVQIYSLLEKYNKRKRNYLVDYAEYKKGLKCKKCPDSVFKSPQSLIDHYITFHRLSCNSDFTILSFGWKHKTTGLYRCAHCMTQLNGIRKLYHHLDRHKEKMKGSMKDRRKKVSSVGTSQDSKPTKRCRQNEVLTSAEELRESGGLPSSSKSSPSKVQEEQPEAEVKEDRHPCTKCHRTFSSLKGLRTHEKRHAVLAAIKKLYMQPKLNQDIEGLFLYKTGTLKPFRCSCCTYRTNLMGLLQSHILKNHQDILQKKEVEVNNKEEIPQKAEKEPSESSERTSHLPELDEDPEETEESLCSEPANVQRQLNHYNLMAQNTDKTNTNTLESALLEDTPLHCEICNFNTEHLSSIRRHYLNRHGKKMLRCKDCEFVTVSRKVMEMHLEMGHSTFQFQPTHLKDLRCPFCLYQTKNKNSMIDHIVLHREERVVPIEVRRPKLSRYLEGVVFRCHKCTFSSGSAENLRLHVMRHNDVRPYQCRLCYFDCAQLTDLEAHLSDKHQVLRNHELVGQVSLDQLEARIGGMPQKDEELTNSEEMETEELDDDFDEVPPTNNIKHEAEEEMLLPAEAEENLEKNENEESCSKSSVSDTQHRDAQHNTDVQKWLEQDSQTHEVNVALNPSAEEEKIRNSEANDCKNADVQYEDCSDPEKEEQTSGNQTRLTDEEDEKTAEKCNSFFLKTENPLVDTLYVKDNQQRERGIEEEVENDIVHHILQLDEDDSTCKFQMWNSQKQTVKVEQDVRDEPLPDEEDGATSPNLKTDISTNSVSGEISSTQLHNSFGVLLTNTKLEQNLTPETCKNESQPSVLENKHHQEEKLHPGTQNEDEETDDLEQKHEEELEKMSEDETQSRKPDTPDALPTTDEAAEVLSDDKRFTCQLCGRNLPNDSELNRHVKRHGL